MAEKEWKLDVDLGTYDAMLDGFTFDDLILTVHCNCPEITPEAVKRELKEIIDARLEDMYFLLENNMDAIIAKAKEGRAQYEQQ